MGISETEVRRVARLARLRIDEAQVRLYQGQLEKILEHMAELKTLDTTKAAATSHVLGLVDVTRLDEPRVFEGAQDLAALAPERVGPFYRVRKVIE